MNNINKNEKFNLKNKFKYWFDNKMTKGSIGLIRILIAASLILAIAVAGLIILFRFNEEGEVISVFWDSIATIINAWMPTFESGSLGYLILMTIVAIAGVLFTSVLIGIVTSAIEEKIASLKKGNSIVLEKNHIVLLGFYPGEYTLLRQLIFAAAGNPTCIVIAEEMDREEMEQYIYENLNIPQNIRIVCRTANITDPVSLEKCSVETCKTIIVSPTEDIRTIKTILAVSALLEEKGVPEISVNAIISKEEYRFPPSIAEANNITTLQTNNILAKIIAHSCTQTGLSETFREVFDFECAEFYLIDIPKISGLTFDNLMDCTNKATPVGIYRNGKININPNPNLIIEEKDKILVFSEDINSIKIEEAIPESIAYKDVNFKDIRDLTDTVIIGQNETLPIIIQELPRNVSNVYIANQEISKEEQKKLEDIALKRDLNLKYSKVNLHSEKELFELAQKAEHIIILNNHNGDYEETDMEAIFLLMNLRDIRKRYKLSFNITVEIQQEHNQKLVGYKENIDFIVSSNMSSLILAQLAENPELKEVFHEILSNEGNELYLKNAGQINLEGTFSVHDIRKIMLKNGYIFLGYTDSKKNSHFNLPLEETITLTKEDNIIVLGEK